MRIGLSLGAADLALVKRADELGFEHLLVGDHPIMPVKRSSPFPGAQGGELPAGYDSFLDPLISLTLLAGATKRIKLGTGILLVPERNPMILAKQIATLDQLSGGRFILGVGAGWLKEESEILGVDFPHRWAQTREAVLAMKEIWTKEESEYHGTYYDFPPIRSFPKPIQKPHPPILIGNNTATDRAMKRIVDWADGWMPPIPIVSIEEIKHGRTVLDKLAVEAGRDPRSIQIMAFDYGSFLRTRDALEDLEAAGIDWAHLSLGARGDEALDALEELARDLLF